MKLSFRRFLEADEVNTDPPDLYQAASDELNTRGEVGIQVFDWVPFDDGIYRFGQAFQVVKKDDEDKDSDTIWIKPVTGKQHGDEEEDDDPGPSKLNVMKCARKDPDTNKMVRIECPPLEDTGEFPISKKDWAKMVNKPFQQMAGGMGGGMGGMGGGMGGMGGLPGM